MSKDKIIKWAMPHIKSFRCYIDVGAHDGDTSVPFVETFTKVYAFEPNPTTFDKIPENIYKYNFALADTAGYIDLVIPGNTKNPEHGSTSKRRNKNWVGETFQVQMTTLDSFNFSDVDFIKIDVEQGELEVVKGAMLTIKKYKPTIMFENKRNENDLVIDILTDIGYTIEKHKSDTVAFFG